MQAFGYSLFWILGGFVPFFVIAKDENQMVVFGIPYLTASYLQNLNNKHTVEKSRS